MTKNDAAFLSCRVLALAVGILAINTLSFVPSVFSILLNSTFKTTVFGVPALMLFSVLPLLLLLAVAGGLWAGAPRLAARMTDTSAPQQDAPLTPGTVQTIAFSVVGAFLVAVAIPEAVRQGVTHLLSSPDVQTSDTALFVGKNWEIGLRLVAGLWLLTGAPTLSRWVSSLHLPVPHHS